MIPANSSLLANSSLGVLFNPMSNNGVNFSSGGGAPFDFPPPPGGGGGGLSAGNFFNNFDNALQFFALQKAIYSAFEPLNSTAARLSPNLVSVLSASDFRTSFSNWVGDIFSSSILGLSSTSSSKNTNFEISISDLLTAPYIPSTPVERTVCMLRRGTAEQKKQSPKPNYYFYGHLVIQLEPESVESEADPVPSGEDAGAAELPLQAPDQTRGFRHSGIYGFEIPDNRRRSSYLGFEGLDPTLENLQRDETVSDIIETFAPGPETSAPGPETSDLELVKDLAHWLVTDVEDQQAMLEITGFDREVLHGGAGEIRRSFLEKADILPEDVEEFYAAAATLGFNFNNIAKLREINLACAQSDDLETFKKLLNLNTLVDPKGLNLNDQEAAGLERVVQDLAEKVFIKELVAYYLKEIEAGNKSSDKKIFSHLLTVDKHRDYFKRLQAFKSEYLTELERRKPLQQAELEAHTQNLIAKQKEIDASKKEPQDPPKAASLAQLERKRVIEREGDFGAELIELHKQIRGSHRLLNKDLALTLRTKYALID